MTDGQSHASVDELLDGYIAAWHAGEAPSLERWVDRAAADEQAELSELIAAFLQLAPSVEASTSRGLELMQDPLVQRLSGLEGERWDAHASAAWGGRLRTFREQAGLTLDALGGQFAARFGLAGADATSAADALERLESGALPSAGVAARAARALEELVGAKRGALASGAAPALGAALMRGEAPPADGEREQLTELLRQVDDALPPGDRASGRETLHGLLGA